MFHISLTVLSNWVISHLLRLLSVPGVNAIHRKAETVLGSILTAMAGQNMFLFRYLAIELVDCLAGNQYFLFHY